MKTSILAPKALSITFAAFGLLALGAGCQEAKDATTIDPLTPASDLLIVGIDEKVTWNDEGVVFSEGGQDHVVIYDISDRLDPQLVVDLNLENSIFGPPVNLAISPNQSVALVANSTVHVPTEEGGWTFEPNTQLHVLDLGVSPPALVETIDVGRQPSGLTFVGDGELALVANRNSQTLSVLSVNGTTVRETAAIDAGGEQVAAVAVTPDGTLAVAAKFQEQGKLALFYIDQGNVTYRGNATDIEVGAYPYNVAITPDGQLALSADNGNNGASDGNVNTVSVVDLTVDPPARVAQLEVGDGPEGLAISPDGKFAVVALIDGSNAPADAPFKKDVGSVVALSIEGKNVTVLGEPIAVGALPEGVVFSADSRFVYVGNYLSKTISILQFVDGRLVDTGAVLETPGQPGSMR